MLCFIFFKLNSIPILKKNLSTHAICGLGHCRKIFGIFYHGVVPSRAGRCRRGRRPSLHPCLHPFRVSQRRGSAIFEPCGGRADQTYSMREQVCGSLSQIKTVCLSVSRVSHITLYTVRSTCDALYVNMRCPVPSCHPQPSPAAPSHTCCDPPAVSGSGHSRVSRSGRKAASHFPSSSIM